MSEGEGETFWLTRWALSKGIRSVQARISRFPSGEAYASNVGGADQVFERIGTDAFRTRAEAVTRAEAMRDAKIASLRRQIAKLEAMTFEEDAA